MTLAEYCDSLDGKQKLKLAVLFIKAAMPVWEKFSETGKLTYRDSTVWMKHHVDKYLLQNVIKEVEIISENSDKSETADPSEKIINLYNDFSDPVTAIQDDDWKLPGPAEKIFFSVYNLLSAIVLKDESKEGESSYYVSINQAIDVIDSEKLLSEEEIKLILYSVQNKKMPD
jgi:hypothetical protein